MGLREYCAEYGQNPNDVPEIAERYKGRTLIVCGDGWTVWDDLERLGCRDDKGPGNRGGVKPYDPDVDFMVVNGLGCVFPGKIEHWYSNEPAILNKYIAARRPEYAREWGGANHTHSCNRGAKWKWPFGGHGTSGLGAILCGLGMGYQQIIICGMPLDNGPHNGEPPWRRCRFETAEVASSKNGGWPTHWKRAIAYAFDGKVAAMSGRPNEWIGGPNDPRNSVHT